MAEDKVGLNEEVRVGKELLQKETVSLSDSVIVTKEPGPVYIDPERFEVIPKEKAEQMQKEGDRLKKEYDKKAHDLYLEMCRKSELGPSVAVAVFRDLVQESERQAVNVRTVDLFLNDWSDNFRQNLERGYFKGADGRTLLDVLKPTACMCVGAGPSLSDEQIDLLKGWPGCVLCVNKSVKRLLERGVAPTVITALHSTETVLGSFQHDIVRENLHKSYIMLPTTIHPDVAKEILAYADAGKVYWFHASCPDELVPNLDNLYQSMVKLPVIDTGGNVGLFNMAVSEQMRPKAIGFIGMDLCDPKESVRTNVESLESTFMYFPEDGQEFVLSKVFRGYLQVMMDWYGTQVKRGLPIEVINCTPVGMVYCRRRDWIPYMTVKDFVTKYI